jgi:predicted nucleic acid-binding protein
LEGQSTHTGRNPYSKLAHLMVLCDTNILIHFFNDDERTVSEMDKIGRPNLALPSVVVMELYRGMGNKTELVQMRKRLGFYDVIHLNEAISAQAVYLLEQFKLSQNLQIPDALIGATALVLNVPLFTYNVKDFGFMPGLRLHAAQNQP